MHESFRPKAFVAMTLTGFAKSRSENAFWTKKWYNILPISIKMLIGRILYHFLVQKAFSECDIEIAVSVVAM